MASEKNLISRTSRRPIEGFEPVWLVRDGRSVYAETSHDFYDYRAAGYEIPQAKAAPEPDPAPKPKKKAKKKVAK